MVAAAVDVRAQEVKEIAVRAVAVSTAGHGVRFDFHEPIVRDGEPAGNRVVFELHGRCLLVAGDHALDTANVHAPGEVVPITTELEIPEV